MDTCLKIKDDGTTTVTIYRKPTRTDQYLNFNSNHHLQHKRSVVRTLLHRADVIVTDEGEKQQEIKRVKDSLRDNGYKNWMFDIPPPSRPAGKEFDVNVSLPYVKGVSEKLRNIFRNHGVGIYHKPVNTLRQLLVHPKDKTEDQNKCGVIYKIECPDCHELYIGETSLPKPM